MAPKESPAINTNEQLPWLKSAKDGGLSLLVAAQPNAKWSEIVGEQGGYLKIRVASPPVDGAANEELVRFLASTLKIKQRQIELVRGAANRRKEFLIQGVSFEAAWRILGGLSRNGLAGRSLIVLS